MNKTITLRITKRSQPLLAKVDEIAKAQPVGKDQFAPMLLDLLEIGIKSYESGNRLNCGEIINMNQSTKIAESNHAPTIKNEVAKTLYPTLIGLIVSLGYLEKSKETPNDTYLSLYRDLRDVLSEEHRNFNKLSDADIEQRVSILSPIIKEMVANGQSMHHEILEKNINKIKNLERGSMRKPQIFLKSY